MQIPYEVTARPDTGLYNAKLGIWLFLASEVMLFGGLFSAYVFLRMGADDGYWPHGLLNVPVGTFNTAVLIISSVTIVLAWASLKMRRWSQYKLYLGITIACGLLFLVVKLGYEYPQKFQHFGAFIQKDKWAKYEAYLGNEHLKKEGLPPRPEITGHLEAVEIEGEQETVEAFARENDLVVESAKESKEPALVVHNKEEEKGVSPRIAEHLVALDGVKLLSFEVKLDQVNADPDNRDNDRPHFIPPALSNKTAKIEAEDVDSWSAFFPKHSSYFSVYFTITGLHGLHVLGGVIVMTYFFFFGEKLYRRNPEHMANRIEVCGLFWHFVDLVWIFVFPIFYLL